MIHILYTTLLIFVILYTSLNLIYLRIKLELGNGAAVYSFIWLLFSLFLIFSNLNENIKILVIVIFSVLSVLGIINKIIANISPIRIILENLAIFMKNFIRFGISEEKIFSRIEEVYGVNIKELEKRSSEHQRT